MEERERDGHHFVEMGLFEANERGRNARGYVDGLKRLFRFIACLIGVKNVHSF